MHNKRNKKIKQTNWPKQDIRYLWLHFNKSAEGNEIYRTHRKTKCKQSLIPKPKQDFSGLKRSSDGLWMIGWKWYSVINHRSALAEE